MRDHPRPRRYVSFTTMVLTRPLLRYSVVREAYVLRIAGNRIGPVLRLDRRDRQHAYHGAERRRVAHS